MLRHRTRPCRQDFLTFEPNAVATSVLGAHRHTRPNRRGNHLGALAAESMLQHPFFCWYDVFRSTYSTSARVMAVKQERTAGLRSTAAKNGSATCGDAIRRALSKMPVIDAVFLLTDDANVVHVFSVVREFQPKLYDRLLEKERAIEKDLPHIAFEFHVRAHQGRAPVQCVPFEAELVYAR